jgi:hypothetical protein
MYKFDVRQSFGGESWCVQELTFYDLFGNPIAMQPPLASAQSNPTDAGRAFDLTANNDAGEYCATNPWGWLDYRFPVGVAPIASYSMKIGENKKEHAPASWRLGLSMDGGVRWTIIDDQTDVANWDNSFTPATQYAHSILYMLEVSKNNGAENWCIQELSFYDVENNLVETAPNMAWAETQSSDEQAAGMAFDGSIGAGAGYYCSQGDSGWLQYQFPSGATPISSYGIEPSKELGNSFAPVSWVLKSSLDGGRSWSILDARDDISAWTDGETKYFAPGVHGPLYKLEVTESAESGGAWCIQEMSFYDHNGERMNTRPQMATAEEGIDARGAFDELTSSDPTYHCFDPSVVKPTCTLDTLAPGVGCSTSWKLRIRWPRTKLSA